jgi:competence protein ComEC
VWFAEVESSVKKHSQAGTNLFPLAHLAFAFAIGIVVGHWLLPLKLMVPCALACALGSLAFLLASNRRLATIFLTASFIFAGAVLITLEHRTPPGNRLRHFLDAGDISMDQPVEVTGVLERNPEVAHQNVYLNLRVEKIRLNAVDVDASGVIALMTAMPNTVADFEKLELRHGARVRVMTRLDRTNTYRNPGVSPLTEFLDRKGYDATTFVKSPLLIERLGDEPVFLPLALLYDWRKTLQAEIDFHFSPETAGVLNAAVLGNRHALSHATSERFRDGGTFHVLVISGLHITVIGALVFMIVRHITKKKPAQFIASVAIIWAYSLAVGAEASVARAALMFTVVIAGPLISREATPLNALGGVALVLLILNPPSLTDPSFQLTFISVLAIALLAWPLLKQLSAIGGWRPTRETPYPPACASWVRTFAESLFWKESVAQREISHANYHYRLTKARPASVLERLRLQALLRYAFSAVVVSVSVQLALLPFLVVYFHRLSISSVILNIGVSFLIAAVVLVAFLGLAIAPLSPELAAPAIKAADALNWLMTHSVDPFAAAGAASIRLPEYTGWSTAVYVLYYIPLVLVSLLLFRWRPLQLQEIREPRRRLLWIAGLGQLFAIAVIVIHPFSAVSADMLRVDFIDVGQGDAALLTLPDNTTLLIDGGGRPGPFTARRNDDKEDEQESRSIGDSVVSEYLWHRGLHRLDYLIASHADADHIDGLNDVARNFVVRAAVLARTPRQDAEYRKFERTLASRNIPLRTLGAGDELRMGEVTMQILSPRASTDPNALSGNNDSLVIRLRYGQHTLLLTGDIEVAREQDLVKRFPDLRADVVKVAHHGSRTSSTELFVRATRPRFAVISVGQKSIFGHPHREVVERWKAAGAEVLVTGERGMVTFVTNGSELRLETFVKKE